METLLWYLKSIGELLWTIVLVIGCILKGIVGFFYSPYKDISDEIVVLTGGAGDIGSSLATRMARQGCKMVLLDINEERLNSICRTINEYSDVKHKAVSFPCDITNLDQMRKICDVIRTEVGHPTMLINNAGIVAGKYLDDLSYRDFVRTFEVNTFSNFVLVKEFLPNMMENNHGHIVSVSSILALKGLAGVSEYAASKAAVATFMSSLRYEISVAGKSGIHCTTVMPYQLNSNLFRGCSIRFKWVPFMNLLEPSYVAEMIMGAVLKNQVVLYIPRVLYFLVALQNVLPEKANDVLYNYLEANRAMKTHVGRGKKDS